MNNHKIVQKTLPNGISLVMVPLDNLAAVTTVVLMGVGSRFESDAQQGLAHFVEHMVFKGARKYQSVQAVAQALDAVGGEFNAFTSQEFTGFYTKTAGEYLELGVDVLSDMVLHATFPETELSKEKGVIVEEINMYEDMPMRKVDQVLSNLVYGDTPLGRPIIGTKNTVMNFRREDFLSYRDQFYKGSQCTIVLAGALNPDEALKLVERYFGDLPAGEPYRPQPASIAPKNIGERVLLEEKASEQTHLMLASPGYAIGNPSRHAYRVLATILGGNMSSRLFVSVREEQGLCYYVRANPDIYTDTGLLVVSAGVDNNRLNQAVQAIVKELSRLVQEKVGEEELRRAKQFLLGKTMLAMEDSEQVAEFYGMQDLLEKKIETLDNLEEKIKLVTAEEVQAIARELFQSMQLRLAVIGPHKDAQALDKLLVI